MKRLFLLGFIVVLLAACNSANDNDKQSESANDQEVLKELHVEFLTAEDAFEPGEEGKVEIQVTYGDEPVPDADEVIFEIWQHGDEEHDKIEGIHEKDGKYYVTYQFEEGVYYVIPHVTARGLHNMPKQMFLVGDVEAPEEQEESTLMITNMETSMTGMVMMNKNMANMNKKNDRTCETFAFNRFF